MVVAGQIIHHVGFRLQRTANSLVNGSAREEVVRQIDALAEMIAQVHPRHVREMNDVYAKWASMSKTYNFDRRQWSRLLQLESELQSKVYSSGETTLVEQFQTNRERVRRTATRTGLWGLRWNYYKASLPPRDFEEESARLDYKCAQCAWPLAVHDATGTWYRVVCPRCSRMQARTERPPRRGNSRRQAWIQSL
mmetsp:Transcript_92878/g.215856  ORF Transcript_92878/g.215856 Transcript_92878/m.215856 type:complete len:194 (+) Transcript_92878:39-620(+)